MSSYVKLWAVEEQALGVFVSVPSSLPIDAAIRSSCSFDLNVVLRCRNRHGRVVPRRRVSLPGPPSIDHVMTTPVERVVRTAAVERRSSPGPP